VESPKKHILLVDDEPDLRTVLSTLLETLGFEVLSAGSGSEAAQIVEKCHKQGISLYAILSDWMMPNGNGVEFLGKVRSGPAKGTPFVLMTGAYTPEDLQNAQQFGPDATLLKPFNKTVLQNKIEEAVKVRRSRD
jgi:CheY-like chemotaxis protein